MSNFILDRGDEAFADAISSSLKKRGVDWADFCVDAGMQASNKERCLILSGSTHTCDVNSKSFETFLRDQKITKAFILETGASKFEIIEKCNGAIKFVNVPTLKVTLVFFISIYS